MGQQYAHHWGVGTKAGELKGWWACSLGTTPSAVTVPKGPEDTIRPGKLGGLGGLGGCRAHMENSVHMDSLCFVGSKAEPELALRGETKEVRGSLAVQKMDVIGAWLLAPGGTHESLMHTSSRHSG